jgi:Ca2+-transporting ATPase
MTHSAPIVDESAAREAPTHPEHTGQTATSRILALLAQAAKTFAQIDGAQRAGAIAHYAFFSLFPLIILFVAIATVFIDRDQAATQVIGFVQSFVPVGADKHGYIFDTIAGVVKARRHASGLAFLLLGWAAMRFFATLIRGINRAWGIEVHDWWRLPLKSFVFLAALFTAVPVGIAVTLLANVGKHWLLPLSSFSSWIYSLGSFVIPLVLVFVGLSLFYKLAPRRHTRFAQVWAPALCSTLLLLGIESLFGVYLTHFATLNVVYGAFGGIMALLLWIYLSGCIFIFGACLCAAQAD